MVTTERAVVEARRRIELGLKQPALLPIIDRITEGMTVVPPGALAPLISDCEAALRDAVHGHNGSTSDAHLLALAWTTGGDIWTHDRDFAGTGVATWSTANLIVGLAVTDS
jgi:predicted nucleic acid-binding protein